MRLSRLLRKKLKKGFDEGTGLSVEEGMNNSKTEQMKYNTNENVSLVVKARINDREMLDFVSEAARAAVKAGTSLPEDLSDLFTLEVVTRPSGSKYGVLDFA